eukprot:m.40979 g.40979  ORF g.40979 m.40979 type:complete len:173 (+) comp12796_c0_seq1:746-1264(+)
MQRFCRQHLDAVGDGRLCSRVEPGLLDNVYHGGNAWMAYHTTVLVSRYITHQVSCLMPHVSAVNNTAIALAVCSLIALVLLCITLGVHNYTERDFWSGLRDDFIQEEGDVPSDDIVWRSFRHARCYNLLAAALAFQLIFSLFAVTFRRKRYFRAHPRYRGRFIGYGRRGFYI